MYIEKLKLFQFRNHQDRELAPHPAVNIFYGENGSGKTNLLEAIHFCALGRSHRTNQDRECVQKDRKAASVTVEICKAAGRRSVSVRLTPEEEKKKTVFVDRSRAARLSELMGVLQCVMFSPEDLQLVKGSPSLRRRWLDMMISQISREYFLALQQYQRNLDQRNALIRSLRFGEKNRGDLLDIYEQNLAECGELILEKRRSILADIQEEAGVFYEKISGRENEVFRLRYLACAKEEERTAPALMQKWKSSREDDIQRCLTSFGPHREDVGLTLKDREMKLYASQGQCRTAVLSLKLAQMAIFERISGEKPVLLLDDVMSELDVNRRRRLLDEIRGFQTFVTCTDRSDLDGCESERCYQIRLDPEGLSDVETTTEGPNVPLVFKEEDPDFS